MTAQRPTSTAVHLTPAQMRRIEAAGWRPGTIALGEWLTQRAEQVAPRTCPACGGTDLDHYYYDRGGDPAYGCLDEQR
jgi:hypothetical protein